MKKNILFGAAWAFLGLAAAPLFGQTSSTASTTSSGYVQSSSIIGSKIKDARGQDVGEIKDVVLDRSSGCLAYVVLSTHGGGTSTTATKTVAAPWTVFSASSEPRVFMTRIEREKIYSAPVWESTRIEEYSRPEYISQVYGYYGVSVPASFSVSASTTTDATTTGTTSTTAGSTNANATPAATASVAMTPAATASAAASTTPAATGTVSKKMTPTPVPATTASPKAKTTKSAASASPASESASSPESTKSKSSSKKTEATTEKSPKSESSTDSSSSSSSPKKKSSKKTTEPEKPETAPTPEG